MAHLAGGPRQVAVPPMLAATGLRSPASPLSLMGLAQSPATPSPLQTLQLHAWPPGPYPQPLQSSRGVPTAPALPGNIPPRVPRPSDQRHHHPLRGPRPLWLPIPKPGLPLLPPDLTGRSSPQLAGDYSGIFVTQASACPPLVRSFQKPPDSFQSASCPRSSSH